MPAARHDDDDDDDDDDDSLVRINHLDKKTKISKLISIISENPLN